MDPLDSYTIDKKSDIPIWVQLKQRLVYLIMSGSYKPGDQLPTVRELAVQLDINYHTVNKVYQMCIRDRLRPSKGPFWIRPCPSPFTSPDAMRPSGSQFFYRSIDIYHPMPA